MADYYSVTIRITLGVLAESNDDAEELAGSLVDLDDVPAGATVAIDTYLTPNQTDGLRRSAVNS